MIDKKLLFDRVRLEGMQLLCFPEFHEVINDYHLEIQKSNSVYEVSAISDFYFNKVSGRQIDNADWNLNDEIKNLIPLSERFFIEFSVPKSEELPYAAGCLLVAEDAHQTLHEEGNSITDIHREQARNNLDSEIIKNPELDEIYCWWKLVCDPSNSEIGYLLALYEMKADYFRWLIHAYPITKFTADHPIAAPMFIWNIALTESGKVLTSKNRGWVLTAYPITDLIPASEVNEAEHFMRHIVLHPALLGWMAIKDSRTKLWRRNRHEYRTKMLKNERYRAPDYSIIKEEKITGDLIKSFFPGEIT